MTVGDDERLLASYLADIAQYPSSISSRKGTWA
jgi:hypothetical protein